MASGDERAADRLNRYLDQRTGSGAGLRGQPAGRPEESLVQTIQRLDAHDDAPAADPAFADRLLEELVVMTAQPVSRSGAMATGPISRNGRLTKRVWPVEFPRELPRSRWALGHLATAALVLLVLAASLFALQPGRRSGQEDLMYRAQMTPLASDAAIAAPVAEFLWDVKSDPGLPLDGPYYLAIAPDGTIWVDDVARNQFQMFTPDGEFIGTWGRPEGAAMLATSVPGTGAGSFDFTLGDWWLTGLGFDSDGNLYVLDAGHHRVQKFGPDREFLLSWGSYGRGPGQFVTPGALTVDKEGRVYVLDFVRHDIQVFDSEGNYLSAFGGFGDGDGQFYFDSAGSVVTAPDGTIWVTDAVQHRVQKFSPDGEFLMSIGRQGYEEGEFTMPNGVAVDAAGRVYVSDSTNGRIQVLAPDGAFLAAWGSPAGERTFSPNAIVLDGEGHAYVADGDQKRILKYRLKD